MKRNSVRIGENRIEECKEIFSFFLKIDDQKNINWFENFYLV